MKENEMREADLEELIAANGGFDGGTMEQLIEWMKEHGIPYEGPHMKNKLQAVLEKNATNDLRFSPPGEKVIVGPGPQPKDPVR